MSNARVCGNCKTVVPEGHHYCGRCGASYNADGHKADNETLFFGAMQAPGKAKLILIKGEGLEGLSYHLNSTEHVAGRSTAAILFPEDEYLSPRHASFLYRENKLYLRDENSTNGTYVRIRGPRVLESGDQFMVGSQIFYVEKIKAPEEYSSNDNTLMYVSPARNYRLRVVHVVTGGRSGSAYCSDNNSLVIGRESADILFADDRYLSNQNTRIYLDESGQIIISDLDSKNGTFVRLRREQPMEHGDYVFFGSELVRVEINV